MPTRNVPSILRAAAKMFFRRNTRYSCVAVENASRYAGADADSAYEYYQTFAKNRYKHHISDFETWSRGSYWPREHRIMLLLLAAEVYKTEKGKP